MSHTKAKNKVRDRKQKYGGGASCHLAIIYRRKKCARDPQPHNYRIGLVTR